jgi:hypothetical protein
MDSVKWVETEVKYLKKKYRDILNQNPGKLSKQKRLEYLKAYAVARKYFPNLTRFEPQVRYEACAMPLYMTTKRRSKQEKQANLYQLHLVHQDTWKKKDDGSLNGLDVVGCAAILRIISFNNSVYDNPEVVKNTSFILERELNVAM